jgi:hypothetical protein
MARRTSIPHRKNTHPSTDAYGWVADVRDYTRRIKDGPVQAADLAGQRHINEAVQRVKESLDQLNRVLPGGKVSQVYHDLTAPMRTYLALMLVPASLWATPSEPAFRLKLNPASRRTSRGPRRDVRGRFVKTF